MEGQDRVAVPERAVATEGQHLSAEHVVLDRDRPQLARDGLCALRIGADDLDCYCRMTRRRVEDECAAAVALGQQIQTRDDAGPYRAVGPARAGSPG
jgi:hypothetical protein